jgi:prepilin-type N-terminal cleavage/methylation domain-containing protein
MKKIKAFTLIELLVCIAIVAIMFTFVAGIFGGGCTISDGATVGTISKFTKKGLMFKSYEGELVKGGLNQKQGGAVANVWYFSVLDSSLVPMIEDARDHNKLLSLKYHQTLGRNPMTRNTTYVVTGITVITNN